MHSTFTNTVRLYPNQAQAQLLRRSCGCRRYVYNHFLKLQQLKYAAKQAGTAERGYISYVEMCKLLVLLKADPDHEWLQEVNSHALQQTLKDLDKAFKRFFAGKAKYPTAKRRGCGDGFRNPFYCAVSEDLNYVRVLKLGWIRCRGLRRDQLLDSEGKPTFLSVQSVTIKAVADHFEAVVLFRVPESVPAQHTRPGTSCGVDVGIAKPLAVADDDNTTATYGTLIRDRLRRHDLYVKKLQRRLERQQKGSSSRQRTKTKIAKANNHAACIRRDFNHQLSNHLAKTYAMVVTEDLQLKNMTASAAGTVDEPGKNVKQKSGLNRELLRIAPGQLNQFLEYKCKREGGELVRVNPAYSSQECRICHHVDKANRKNQAVFTCTSCGHTENADYNAAAVIRYRGIQIITKRLESAQVEGASRPLKPKPRGL